MAQRVEGELYESVTGQLFELGRQLRQPNGYPFDPQQLKRTLQDAIEGRFPEQKYELYLFGRQKTGGREKGFDIERHLVDTGRIKRARSLESPEVKGWLADPSLYPQEFKDNVLVLWGSIQDSGGSRDVAHLIWDGGRVVVDWDWLGSDWDGDDPALLANADS